VCKSAAKAAVAQSRIALAIPKRAVSGWDVASERLLSIGYVAKPKAPGSTWEIENELPREVRGVE